MNAVSTKARGAEHPRSVPEVKFEERNYDWADCMPLHSNLEQDIAEWLLLSPDGDFLVVEIFGTKGHHSVRALAPLAAKRYLIERGDGDVVDDFPALFVGPGRAGSSDRPEGWRAGHGAADGRGNAVFHGAQDPSDKF
jgi:hypothetical protein